jgi:hypothetical protein
MFAILAVIAFAIALILNITNGSAAHAGDAVIIGLICVAAHMIWGYAPWHRN